MKCQKNKMYITRERSRKEFIAKDYRPGQTLSCLQINNGFQQIRKTSVRFCGETIAQFSVLQLIQWLCKQRDQSRAASLVLTDLSLGSYAWVYYKQNHKPNESLYPSVFVRDSKQRKQDNGGRHWGQRVTTAEQEDRGLWAADSRKEIGDSKELARINGKIWGYNKVS